MVVINGALYCEREYDRGAGCGKTAGPDLYGGHWATGVPTMNVPHNSASVMSEKK
ncbi:MAG: hypothetical protein GY820_19515 [Gammaproteobacteria bacterium]|nr:hypothetical protein [Gammaproteobacteria bacterium]